MGQRLRASILSLSSAEKLVRTFSVCVAGDLIGRKSVVKAYFSVLRPHSFPSEKFLLPLQEFSVGLISKWKWPRADFPFFYAKIGRHCMISCFFSSSSLIGAGLESWGRDIRNVAQASRRAPDEGVLLQRHKSSGFPSGPKAHLPRNWTLRIQVRISLYVLQGNIWNSHGLTCASMTKPTTNSWVMGNFITLSDNNCFKVFIFYSPSGHRHYVQTSYGDIILIEILSNISHALVRGENIQI